MTLLTNGRIRHSVVFTLNHAEGSAEEADFLDAVAGREPHPRGEGGELVRVVSPKNEYRFGLTMEFADPAAYSGYNEHPQHVDFVERRWDAEVSDFLEIDTVAI
jgi:hypothetical protein